MALERRVQMVGLVDQDGVLVDLGALHFDEALADRLDETDAGKACCSAAKSPSEVVVLPSFMRVAATKMRGVMVLRRTNSGRRRGSRKMESAIGKREDVHYAVFRRQ